MENNHDLNILYRYKVAVIDLLKGYFNEKD